MMISNCKFEDNLADHELVNNLNTNWTGYAPSLYTLSYETSTIKDIISEKSRDFYFGKKGKSLKLDAMSLYI